MLNSSERKTSSSVDNVNNSLLTSRCFYTTKKECGGRRPLRSNIEHGLPVVLQQMPDGNFQNDRRLDNTIPGPEALIGGNQGLNLSQSAQRDCDLSSAGPRDANINIMSTGPGQQTYLGINQTNGLVQYPNNGGEMVIQENMNLTTNGVENVVLSDDILNNASPAQTEFGTDSHLVRFQENEVNQQQLGALGMGVLSGGGTASLLHQIPPVQNQIPQQAAANSNQQHVYIQMTSQTQGNAQKMYALQPRDGSNQNYTMGLNLSSINIMPITVTTTNGLYPAQEDYLQKNMVVQNLSKETHILPKPTGSIPSTAVEPSESQGRSASDAPRQSKPTTVCKKFTCQYCCKGFTRAFDLDQHVRSHTGEKPFQCIVCGRAFSQKSNVKKHMETHKVWPKKALEIMPQIVIIPREENGDGTEKVKQTQERADGITQSAVAVLAANTQYCPYCDQVLGSYKERKSHMLRHKDKQVYKCVKEGCDQTFPELDDFVEHVKTHEGSMTYRCHHCHKLFDTLHNLGVHQYQAHLNDKSKTAKFSKVYQCKLCPAKFSHPDLLQKHMAMESHNHRCSLCTKQFSCERYLRKHMASAHSDCPQKKVKCTTCGQMIKSIYYMRSHMLIHTKENPFKCEICPAAFNRKDKLKRHMVVHDPIKRYRCPFRETLGCKKEFNRPDKLKAHIICHNGIRAHKCAFCPKRYTRKCFKVAHEKVHTGEFRCRLCLKGFGNQKKLESHKCKPAKESRSASAARAKSAGRRKMIKTVPGKLAKKNAISTDILNLPDGPMYAIRSGSKRRHLRRAKSQANTNARKINVEIQLPNQDEASTEESEVEVEVEE